jgi:4-hydroxy-tetrahydrodipicolinate reductase
MRTLIISGANGRMGREVAQRAAEAGFLVTAGVDSQPAAAAGYPVFTSFDHCPVADAVIDFSRPDALAQLSAYAIKNHIPAVLGTTGYSPGDFALIDKMSESVPVFQSANMGLGVYALCRLAKMAKQLLPGFDIEIVEKHHNQKADSPSGTALTLLKAVSGGETVAVYGRQGAAKRDVREIGVHAIRGGTVTGVHEVGFYGPDETVTLTHTAQSRAVFASGALRAAVFLAGKPNGRYGMDDLAEALLCGLQG